MRCLITGGAGFIGSNAADRLLREGHQVTLLDNLSRAGVEHNLAWLRQAHGDLEWIEADVRDAQRVAGAVRRVRPELVLHLAAQTAVTTSLVEPRRDFETNATGTLNVLEALRLESPEAVLFYASTNKVYGALAGATTIERATRHELALRPHGLAEDTPLEFHTPYGCSKGCGDQYVLEYHRSYGLRTVCFRLSCIYGPHQFGVPDQGWVAWFVIAALLGRRPVIYGDGKQVRDVLHVDDLLDAVMAAHAAIDRTAGRAFNIGGGPRQTISVWREFGPLVEARAGHPIETERADWRPGDQRCYVSDIRLAQRTFGWAPRIPLEQGLAGLWSWAVEQRAQIEAALDRR